MRSVAAALLLGGASMLGACSPFSSSIADMWPHWAGGEPTGLPPRPGQPGYEQFIAHGQPDQNAPAAPAPPAMPAGAQPTPVGATGTIAERKAAPGEPKPPAFAEPQETNGGEPVPEAIERPAGDSAVVRGGLY
jgi:hypothetical protein